MSELAVRRRSLPLILRQILGRGTASEDTYMLDVAPGVEVKLVDSGSTAKIVITVDKVKLAASEADARLAHLFAAILSTIGSTRAGNAVA